MTTEPKFKRGDAVKLRHGQSPVMTVVSNVTTIGHLDVMWFDADVRLQLDTIPQDFLISA